VFIHRPLSHDDSQNNCEDNQMISNTLKHIVFNQLELEEGYKKFRYKCDTGHWTIGKGYNLDANPLKLSSTELEHLEKFGCSEEKADELLLMHVEKNCLPECESFEFWDDLDDVRKYVLIGMVYQMGSIKSWKNTLAAIGSGDYEKASRMMLQSKWAKQTPNRANFMAEIMKTGVIPHVHHTAKKR
jgi:lysozyme